MSGGVNNTVKYGVKDIISLIEELGNASYFMFMIEDRDVAEAWVKACITNVTNEYVNGDWRKYFDEVTVEEFAEESKVLNNLFAISLTPIRKGIIICREPFAYLVFTDVNVIGFIVEDDGDYEIHYLIFNGYDVNTREERKLLIKTKVTTKGGVLYRVMNE